MIVDAYAGPGGWSEGLRALGLTDIGIELDPSACATAHAAGHRTIRADVARFPLDHLAGRVDGLIMSPPCQAFSTAGKGEGRQAIDDLRAAIAAGDWDWSHDDDRVRHVLEVGRWAETLHPTWIACEQVPPVLPIWQTYADRWRHRHGWSVWAGILNAADYGVPQTRRRAFLIARTDGQPAVPPRPTHCRGGALTIEGELLPWLSMADALGWVDAEMHHQRGRGMAERHGELPGRPSSEPAMSITAGAGRRMVLDRRQTGAPVLDPAEVPSPTMTGAAIGKGVWTVGWAYERPATAVCGDPRLSPPGYRGRPDDYQDDGTIKLTIRDALILQGFDPDYPVQGTRTKQFEQVGNAVPPPVAAAVIAAVTGQRMEKAA